MAFIRLAAFSLLALMAMVACDSEEAGAPDGAGGEPAASAGAGQGGGVAASAGTSGAAAAGGPSSAGGGGTSAQAGAPVGSSGGMGSAGGAGEGSCEGSYSTGISVSFQTNVVTLDKGPSYALCLALSMARILPDGKPDVNTFVFGKGQLFPMFSPSIGSDTKQPFQGGGNFDLPYLPADAQKPQNMEAGTWRWVISRSLGCDCGTYECIDWMLTDSCDSDEGDNACGDVIAECYKPVWGDMYADLSLVP